jgi:hypothetical protein
MWTKVEDDLPVLDTELSDLLGNTVIDYSRDVLIRLKDGNIVNASLGKDKKTKEMDWACDLLQDSFAFKDVVEWCEVPG